MYDLGWYQYSLIALLFVWSGFVRSGLGFGGAVFALPFLLLVINDPVIWLPIISIHLLFFSALTVFKSHQAAQKAGDSSASTIDWSYLGYSLSIMIIPKLIGVFGLVTLNPDVLSSIIFVIIAAYSCSYILNKPFVSKSKIIDALFLMLGGYISGTSLIGAPLVIAVYANHIQRHQLRDTLFVLWFILVAIKMAAFIYMHIDLQLIHQLWLLPSAAVGHWLGLRFHQKALQAEPVVFYRGLGIILLITSMAGLLRILLV
jgi:uncharacterized membrane protein YfcA